MIIKFQKFQGADNDFIIIDNRTLVYDFTPDRVKFLCDRKFGIGADGLMLLEDCPEYDFRMRYFNADGKEASMCGNGGRCITVFAHNLGLFSESTRFAAVDGPHEARLTSRGVQLKMCDVQEVIMTDRYYFLHTGSPHCVIQSEQAFEEDVLSEGRRIRYSKAFQPEGTNVDFITPRPDYIEVATYERGVENETLACGTGCVASALSVAIFRNDTHNTYDIHTKGGNLQVSFVRHPGNYFSDIWLEGPAECVFTGEIEIKN